MIERWYNAVLSADGQDMAIAIAALGGMVKGYGETRYRTTSRLMRILDYLEHSCGSDPSTVTALHLAAMEPDSSFEPGDVVPSNPELT
jgi:indolepyruvate ferredoxin oxidoreductase beta subunit